MKINRRTLISLIFVLTLFLCFTFLRKFLFLVYPFIAVMLFWLLDLRLTNKGILALLAVIFISILSMLINGLWVANNFLSLYFIVPTIFLSVSRPSQRDDLQFNNIEIFWKISSYVLIAVNITAYYTFIETRIIDAFITPLGTDRLDDSFHGIFGTEGLGGHILSIFNVIYAFRFFLVGKKKLAIFFLVSSLLGFYGLGFVLVILTIFWVYRRIMLKKKIIKYLSIGVVLFVGAVFIIRMVNPNNYRYIKNVLESFLVTDFNYSKEMETARDFRATTTPRKITFFAGVFYRLKEDPEILIYGTSPGTYNSRTAFLLNGDLSRTSFLRDNVKFRPPYHAKDIFWLFNATSTKISWMGGTRHQPFSSIVSVLIEYGLVSFMIIFGSFYGMGHRAIELCQNDSDRTALKFILTLSFFLFLMVYYLEIIEFMIPIILLFKSYESTVPDYKHKNDDE